MMNLPRLRRIGGRLASVAIAIMLTAATLLVGGIWLVPRFTTIGTLTVLTGSMDPAIPRGSLVFVRPIDPERVAVGDVVTFHPHGSNDALVTHRVTEVIRSGSNELSFRTKGDANKADDPYPTPADRLVGEVVLDLPYIGYVSQYAMTPRGALLFIGIPLALFTAGNLHTFVKEVGVWRRERGERRSRSTDPAAEESSAADDTAPELFTLGPARAQVALVAVELSPGSGNRLLVQVAGDPGEIDRFIAGLRSLGSINATRSSVVERELDGVDLAHPIGGFAIVGSDRRCSSDA